MEWDPNHPQDQPDFSDNGRALLSRSKSHINTLHNLVFYTCFSLLTYYPVMFRCCSSLTSLWGTPCQPWSAPHKRTPPRTVWFCAMGWQPRCGSASGFCRYIYHYSSLTSCFFPIKYKKIQVLAQSPLLKMCEFLPIGDLLYCVSWALRWGQNPSVCRSLLHQ